MRKSLANITAEIFSQTPHQKRDRNETSTHQKQGVYTKHYFLPSISPSHSLVLSANKAKVKKQKRKRKKKRNLTPAPVVEQISLHS